MPSTKKAQWIAKKRASARHAGLCSRCYTQRPNPNYSVCHPCQERINEYRRRRSKAARERREWSEIVSAHETAGDNAHTFHLFDTAAQHYRRALSVAAIAHNDRQRLVEKLGTVSSLTSDPGEANPWNTHKFDLNL